MRRFAVSFTLRIPVSLPPWTRFGTRRLRIPRRVRRGSRFHSRLGSRRGERPAGCIALGHALSQDRVRRRPLRFVEVVSPAELFNVGNPWIDTGATATEPLTPAGIRPEPAAESLTQRPHLVFAELAITIRVGLGEPLEETGARPAPEPVPRGRPLFRAQFAVAVRVQFGPSFEQQLRMRLEELPDLLIAQPAILVRIGLRVVPKQGLAHTSTIIHPAHTAPVVLAAAHAAVTLLTTAHITPALGPKLWMGLKISACLVPRDRPIAVRIHARMLLEPLLLESRRNPAR